MTKLENFNEKIFKVWASDLDDTQDVKACFDALMLQYGVQYKKPLHLKSCFVDKCDQKFKGNVEEMFLDEINTVAHGKVFELMNEACNDFMDYSKAAWIRRPMGYGHRIDSFIAEILNR